MTIVHAGYAFVSCVTLIEAGGDDWARPIRGGCVVPASFLLIRWGFQRLGCCGLIVTGDQLIARRTSRSPKGAGSDRGKQQLLQGF
ncbi:hypothetical protein [Mycolicibacterium vanbaalenii]|uniref:hypothetical protein n=1 Tax=Mycolicibacterium vanbaalenii TaxID=110539 RepID=UPI001F2EE8F0|nr:hypothetical protein [Mycolicibacterium vanbaalenii]